VGNHLAGVSLFPSTRGAQLAEFSGEGP
jgi:hypothetical protein